MNQSTEILEGKKSIKMLQKALLTARAELVEYISNRSHDEKHARENIGNSKAICAIDLALKKASGHRKV